jgi:hypothetical protein
MWLYCAAAIFLTMVGFYTYLIRTAEYEPDGLGEPEAAVTPGLAPPFADPFGPMASPQPERGVHEPVLLGR